MSAVSLQREPYRMHAERLPQRRGRRAAPLHVHGEAILILDIAGSILFCSDAAILRQDRSDIVGRSIRDLIPTLPLRPDTPGYNIAYASFRFGDGDWQQCGIPLSARETMTLEFCVRPVRIESTYWLVVALRELAPRIRRTAAGRQEAFGAGIRG